MLNVHHDRGSIPAAPGRSSSSCCFGVTAAVAAAQSGFVTFSGTIVDETARGIPGATVVLTNKRARRNTK